MAARRGRPPKNPRPEIETNSIASRAIDAAKVVFSPPVDDPRPEAWRAMLVSAARKEPFPKPLRIHQDPRFTGEKRVAQVQALTAIGIEPEEAADKILQAAMDEHRGEKHCDW